MKRVLPLTIALSFALHAGCQTEPVDTGDNPMIRTLSAAIDNSPLDICVNGFRSIEDIDTGGRTGHGEADRQSFEMATGPTGTSCDDATPVSGLENINLNPNRFSTVVILPDGVSAIQLTDDNTLLSAGQAEIRVINMCEDCGAVSVTNQNDNEIFTDVAFNTPADFAYRGIAAGTYDFIVTSPADENRGRIIESFEIEEGTTYTIFVTGRVDSAGAEFRANVFEDLQVGIVITVG
ncbi:MAG: hypothetical protein DHS20C16_33810 [Phycisphaerae bacterium]|nr:MAG: hypothetical protein DHS20C16_33810 [Phycisphaerae bacterium]